MRRLSRWRLPILYAVALALACACVVGGVAVVKERGRRDDAAAAGKRYGDVDKAAESVALAMVNIDFQDPQKSIDAVSAAATGTFLDQYKSAAKDLTTLVTQAQASLTSTISSSAVSSLDRDSATVLVATEGKVTNEQTSGDSQARYFRFLIKLVRKDGAWLANELDIVG